MMNRMKTMITMATSLLLVTSSCSSSTYSDIQYVQQAELFKEKGNIKAATESYRQAIALNPNNFQANFLLGVTLCKQGLVKESIPSFKQALKQQPANVRVLFNLGVALEITGNIDKAIEHYKKAVAFFHPYTQAHLRLASCLEKEQPTEALKHYLIVIKLDPHSFDAHLAAAKLLCEQDELTKSLELFDKAYALKPATNDVNLNLANEMLQLGNKLFGQRRGQEAAHVFRNILSINDNYSAVHHNLAFTLAERLGKHYEALKHYRRAIEIKPENHEAHFCFALSCLATGDLSRGWQEYKHRWLRPRNAPRRFGETFEHLWEGQDLEGKTIAIRCEQGLGDTLHFIRYAQMLKECGAYVIAEVQKPLTKLLASCQHLDEIVQMGHPMPPCDYQIPMLNLPAVFGTSLETIPNKTPYLHPMPKLEKKWKEYLEKDTNFKIGICWHGDAAHGQVKFMPLSCFVPLLNIENTSFYSLQKISGLEQLKDLPANVTLHQFGPDFDKTYGSFMDTAAVMKSLDLVITADTSIAHLAGGLGVQTWIILPFPAEWRWLMNRDDSPWYPTVRLFRQKKINEWQPVVQKIKKALKETVKGHPFPQ
ncbi:tetratricopeptide repeat protein [Candidatus Dependentiae bacterium]